MPPTAAVVRCRASNPTISRSLSQCMQRPDMPKPAVLNVCWNCHATLNDPEHRWRRMQSCDNAKSGTPGFVQATHRQLQTLPNAVRDQNRQVEVAITDLIRTVNGACEIPRFRAIEKRLHLCDQIHALAQRHSELMASFKEVCQQAAAQADAYKKARAELTKIMASVTTGDLDGLVNAGRIEDDIRALNRMICDLNCDPLDEFPDLPSLTPAQAALAQKQHLQSQVLSAMNRRLAEYRSTTPALTALLDKYGSAERIAACIRVLSDENARLRLRERRFEHDPLLKRRPYGSMTLSFLHCLVFALQNELVANRVGWKQQAVDDQNRCKLSSLFGMLQSTRVGPSVCDISEVQKRLKEFSRRYRSALHRGVYDQGPESPWHQAVHHFDEAVSALKVANDSLADFSELCTYFSQQLCGCDFRADLL